nr:MAG TPA: hypothetical protein [Caudoviricetes sp.]
MRLCLFFRQQSCMLRPWRLSHTRDSSCLHLCGCSHRHLR